MSASIDEALQEAADTLYALNADEAVRKRCRDRLEYYQDLKNYERKIERDRIEHEQQIKQIVAEKDSQIQQLRAELEEMRMHQGNDKGE